MPFDKIPITHKFGIISQSHKRQLQERLIQRRRQLENDARRHKKHEDMLVLNYYLPKSYNPDR